jgi:hypothetical protein
MKNMGIIKQVKYISNLKINSGIINLNCTFLI